MRAAVAAAMVVVLAARPLHADVIESCPLSSPDDAWTGSTLSTATTRSGVTYQSSPAHLELDGAAGLFKSTSLGISDLTVFAAVGDFNHDGWDDFVGTGEDHAFVRIYENQTYANPAPDWSDPSAVRTPKFVNVKELVPDALDHEWRPIATGDFNGDGWPDIFYAVAVNFARPSTTSLWLNKGANDAAGHAQFLAPYAGNASGVSASTFASQLGYQSWGGSNIMAYDWNGDRKLDLLVGSGENNGEIRVFTNQCTPAASGQPAAPALLRCSNNPTFKWTATLVTNLGFGTATQGGLPVFTYGNFNGDAYPDLVVGAPDCCASATTRLRFFPGKAGGTLDTAGVQSISFVGAATGVFGADFSQDGKLDLIVTCDNWNYQTGVVGGMSFYYVNDGSSVFPFSGPPHQQLTDHNAPSIDFDTGFVFDYDHDPKNTPDVMIADGNHTTSFYILANRNVPQYVDCGDIASGVIPLGALSSSEMVVDAARIHPVAASNGGTISYYLTNETPPNWVPAVDCADGTGDLCATFPKSAGRDVQWKATMCSGANHSRTPTLTSVTARFVYTTASEHYRAGVIVNDGISYVGAFREPGDRGDFYAVDAALDHTYWNAAPKLDATADAARHLYTQHRDTGERLDFAHQGSSVNAGLVATLGASDATQAASVIDWVRSARFGVGNSGIPLTRMGAIETSTPAILTRPGLPVWYVFAQRDERDKVDEFVTAESQRRNLVLVGSKDGLLHAFRTLPDDVTNPQNGQEAWGFVPTEIAGGMVADYSASLGGTLTIASYPDGSPTLADVADDAGHMSTIAIIGAGNGGKSIAALDVTRTIDPSTDAVIGPTPLWHDVPGGASAGESQSKVAVARVKIRGHARFIAIAGTGQSPEETQAPYQRGRIVVAYDALTGAPLWKFQTRCPLTSDITVFETDDEHENGAPQLDGYMDRAVFADRCGYVYKVDPGQDLGGGWNNNKHLGDIPVDQVDGVQLYALFSSHATSGALGADSPIVGTVGAQIEPATSRVVLFFGTGGLEDWSPALPNEFYAVYADDGTVRSKIRGTCNNGRCEKFYGGVVVSKTQVMLIRTVDPVVGSTTCDRGSSTIQAIELDPDAVGQLVTDFSKGVASAVMGALYGDAGAIYFADLGGDIVRIGAPRAPTAGTDTGGGSGSGSGGGSGSGVGNIDTPMTLLGWRQVY